MQEYQQLPNESVRVLCQPLESKLEDSRLEPYNARSGPI